VILIISDRAFADFDDSVSFVFLILKISCWIFCSFDDFVLSVLRF